VCSNSRVPALRRHDQDLTGRLLGHGPGYAAEHQPAEKPAAVGTEDDGVDLLRLGRSENRLCRIALPDEERRTDPGLSCPPDELLDIRLDPCPFLIDPSQEQSAGKAQPARIDDAQDDKFGVGLDGHTNRLVSGSLGRGRKIRREHEPTNAHELSLERPFLACGITRSGLTDWRRPVGNTLGGAFHKAMIEARPWRDQ
jgi:hypothetical protein